MNRFCSFSLVAVLSAGCVGEQAGEGNACLDSDLDGIDDASDACVGEKETPNGEADDDGCPDSGPVSLEIGLSRFDECPACLPLIADPPLRFESGSSSPDVNAEAVVSAMAARLKDTQVRGISETKLVGVSRVVLVGNTSDIGSDDDNLALGLERAEVLKSMLIERGLNEGLISTTSRGEAEPVASNTTADGQRANDRVDVYFESASRDADCTKE